MPTPNQISLPLYNVLTMVGALALGLLTWTAKSQVAKVGEIERQVQGISVRLERIETHLEYLRNAGNRGVPSKAPGVGAVGGDSENDERGSGSITTG